MSATSHAIADEHIIALLKKGEESGMALVLQKYGGALLGSIQRIVQSKPIAEDIIQDASVKIWENASTYDPGKGRLFTWMLNIARNTAIDKVRTQKFNRQRKTKPIDEHVYDDEALSEEMNIRDVGLTKVIESLEEKYRVVIDLLYFEGYTQQEVSDELGIPLGTIKSRARIGIRELRKILQVGIIAFIIHWLFTFISGY